MALSDKWTQAQIRTAVRRKLLDPSGRWWTDAELAQYIEDWQVYLQDSFELTWNTATITTSAQEIVISSATALSDMMRLDRVYWNDIRLSPLDKQGLDERFPDWRSVVATNTSPSTPTIVYQEDSDRIDFYPPPNQTGTITIEYPISPTFATSTSTMQIPAWTKYSAIPYSCYRAYMRSGPNHDLQRALRWKAAFQKRLKRIKMIVDKHWPERYPRVQPAASGPSYESRLVNPTQPPNTNNYY